MMRELAGPALLVGGVAFAMACVLWIAKHTSAVPTLGEAQKHTKPETRA